MNWMGHTDILYSDIWFKLYCLLQDIAVDPEEDQKEGGEECEHSFVLKDDIGSVCHICGLVDKSIESIIEYEYPKVKRSKSHIHEHCYTKDGKPTDDHSDGRRFSENDSSVTVIHSHPRHSRQMKPHQVEGFNFLVSNLVADDPGGCILANAPGSGKTFMIISFMQSFLTKHPEVRSLVVLPKSILATWKKEFLTWQVEDIPLYDFYSVKADRPSQQLDVLKQWVVEKSILFLGHTQFTAIVSGDGASEAELTCQEVLLKTPQILILDEDHTPRTIKMELHYCLQKVQTPQKVILSGPLYQNHVKEVFNILNLVRPRFLKLKTSHAVVKRIMSKMDIMGVKNQVKSSHADSFYSVVETTLQKDDNFWRKITLIRDLREMTCKVLHYCKGDFLNELPGLFEFTVLLDLSSRQKQEIENLKVYESKFKRNCVGSAVYVHPQLRYFAEEPTASEAWSDNDKCGFYFILYNNKK
ncbi:protein CHROMATIN REMODELING 35-like [Vitis riparia]|uniref:protein CHROMATIN REMODELING 35-like n=1 Tax=Vitis riparia TaxID=96939 RepID=UPI00155A1029|nr:protein CHROMATIN REMODELING 35-like [Vitis riparia]